MSHQNILLTGFEPFAGFSMNPSAVVLDDIPSTALSGWHIEKKLLPVDSRMVPEILVPILRDLRPSVVLSMGLAMERSTISLERVAVNVLDFELPDNAGRMAAGEPVVPGGPCGYFSTIPIQSIVHDLRKSGIPANISNTAGTYICNQVMYLTLHALAMAQSEEPRWGGMAGFVHLPFQTDQWAALQLTKEKVSVRATGASLSRDVEVRAVLSILSACAELSQGSGVSLP